MTAQQYPEKTFLSPDIQSADCRYDLPPEDQAYLSAQLIQESRMAGTFPEGERYVCFRMHGSSPYANLPRAVNGAVFSDDLNDNPHKMRDEYEPYESSTWYNVVIDTESMLPVGALSMTEYGPNGFSATNALQGISNSTRAIVTEEFSEEKFFDEHGIDPKNTLDVGTIAVLKEVRRSAPGTLKLVGEDVTPDTDMRQISKLENMIVSGLLYHGLYAFARENGIDHFVSIIHTDPDNKLGGKSAYATLRGLGIPFYEIDGMEPIYFDDDDTYFQPAVAVLEDFDREMRGYVAFRVRLAEAALAAASAAPQPYTMEQAIAVETAQKNLERAVGKIGTVDILLTGAGLDHLYAQPHKLTEAEERIRQ